MAKQQTVEYNRETVVAELEKLIVKNSMDTEPNLSEHIVAVYLTNMFEELRELARAIDVYDKENRR